MIKIDALITSHLPAVEAAIKEKVAKAVEVTAATMQADMQMMLHEAKSGRVYGTHQASAPGESPAADSGQLSQSIEIEQTADTEQAVYSDSPYAPALEYGRTDGHIAPRPMWTPAAQSAQERLEQELSRLE